MQQSYRLIVADVGNSTLKVGRFLVRAGEPPTAVPIELTLEGDPPAVVRVPDGPDPTAPDRLDALLENVRLALPTTSQPWFAASVNRGAEVRLAAWLRGHRPQDDYVLLQPAQFPLEIDLPRIDRVGTDRLAAAVAANRLRESDRAAIIVDAGTAITVDLVTADGVFRGGAILPGLRTAARALTLVTDALPLLEHLDLSDLPTAVGKSTEEAMRSGIVWGCIATVRELIAQITAGSTSATEVFCTGGDGLPLSRWLAGEVRFEPHLVLQGIALTGYDQDLRSAAQR
jgi:type III pantothenate kinase